MKTVQDTSQIDIHSADHDHYVEEKNASPKSTFKFIYGEKRNRNKSAVQNKIIATFRDNLEVSFRVGIGVVLAGLIAVIDEGNHETSTDRKHNVLPSYYYLGGLTYAATCVLFSSGKTLGYTLGKLLAYSIGITIAILFSMILVSILPISQGGLIKMDVGLSESIYYVSQRDFYSYLPILGVAQLLLFLAPIESNSKKFASALTIYFTLVLINPNDSRISGGLRSLSSDSDYSSGHTIRNFGIYAIIGIVGCTITILIMLFPYPRIASTKLRRLIIDCNEDLSSLLNTILDSYCFRGKMATDIDFSNLKIRNLTKEVGLKLEKMEDLVDDVWWEDLLGISYLTGFNNSAAEQHVLLLVSLHNHSINLQEIALNEVYDEYHTTTLSGLQKKVLKVQTCVNAFLHEMTLHLDREYVTFELYHKTIESLKKSMESTLRSYKVSQDKIVELDSIEEARSDRNLNFSLFVFNLVSLSDTFVDFAHEFHEQSKEDAKQIHFQDKVVQLANEVYSRVTDKSQYDHHLIKTSCKVTFAIVLAMFLSVYIYEFSSTAPSAIAVFMGSHVGGSFRTTLNRVGGIVAGSILPSVLKFYLCRICDYYIRTVLTNITIFIIVVLLYSVNVAGGTHAYLGVVGASVATDLLISNCDGVCMNVQNVKYDDLVQTSVSAALALFIEMLILPTSAFTLLCKIFEKNWILQEKALEMLYSDYSSGIRHDKKLKHLVMRDLPSVLRKQESLLEEALLEPDLWKPPLPSAHLRSILKLNNTIFSQILLLYNLIQWRDSRIRTGNQLLDAEKSYTKWVTSLSNLKEAISDFFAAIRDIIKDVNLLSDNQEAAFILKMKAAFREADADGSGYVDIKELETIIRKIFASVHNHTMTTENINQLVQEFMLRADRNGDQVIELEEYMEEVDGLSFQTRTKVKGNFAKNNSENHNKDTWITTRHNFLDDTTRTLIDFLTDMKNQYAQWLINGSTWSDAPLENLLIMNCFIASNEKLVLQLIELQRILSSE